MIAWNRPWCQIRLSWLQTIILSTPLLTREIMTGQDNYTYHAFPHLCTCFDNDEPEERPFCYQSTSKPQPSSSSWAQWWAWMPPWPFGRALLRMGVFPHIRERRFTLGPEFTVETFLSHWKMMMMLIVQYCHTVAGSHSAAPWERKWRVIQMLLDQDDWPIRKASLLSRTQDTLMLISSNKVRPLDDNIQEFLKKHLRISELSGVWLQKCYALEKERVILCMSISKTFPALTKNKPNNWGGHHIVNSPLFKAVSRNDLLNTVWLTAAIGSFMGKF